MELSDKHIDAVSAYLIGLGCRGGIREELHELFRSRFQMRKFRQFVKASIPASFSNGGIWRSVKTALHQIWTAKAQSLTYNFIYGRLYATLRSAIKLGVRVGANILFKRLEVAWTSAGHALATPKTSKEAPKLLLFASTEALTLPHATVHTVAPRQLTACSAG